MTPEQTAAMACGIAGWTIGPEGGEAELFAKDGSFHIVPQGDRLYLTVASSSDPARRVDLTTLMLAALATRWEHFDAGVCPECGGQRHLDPSELGIMVTHDPNIEWTRGEVYITFAGTCVLDPASTQSALQGATIQAAGQWWTFGSITEHRHFSGSHSLVGSTPASMWDDRGHDEIYAIAMPACPACPDTDGKPTGRRTVTDWAERVLTGDPQARADLDALAAHWRTLLDVGTHSNPDATLAVWDDKRQSQGEPSWLEAGATKDAGRLVWGPYAPRELAECPEMVEWLEAWLAGACPECNGSTWNPDDEARRNGYPGCTSCRTPLAEPRSGPCGTLLTDEWTGLAIGPHLTDIKARIRTLWGAVH